MIPNERLAYWVKGQGEMRDDNDFLMMVLKGTPFAFHVKCFEGGKELCRERKEAQEDMSLTRTIGPPHIQQNNMTLQGLTPLLCSYINYNIVWCNEMKKMVIQLLMEKLLLYLHVSYKVWVKSTAVCFDVTV